MLYTCFKKYHTLFVKGPLIEGPLYVIYTKEAHLEIWNEGLMFERILHLFQRDDAFSWRDIFQIVKTSSLQRMPWSLEQITAYNIHETEFEMVLESVSRRLQVFHAVVYVLKVFSKILLDSFQTEIAVPQRSSKVMHKVRLHSLYGISHS